MAGGRPAIAAIDSETAPQGRVTGDDGYGFLTTAFRDSARFALRDRTAGAHGELDAAFGTVDVAVADGLATFLAAHHAALHVIEPFLRGAPGLPSVPERLDAIEADLVALGRGRPPAASVSLAGHDPLGVAYVVGGSALGGRILARRRAASPDPAVRAARRFMDDQRMMPYWAAVQGALRLLSPADARLERVAKAAMTAFGVYLKALQEVRRDGGR